MGVLSDLVVAPLGYAERVAQATVPAETFGGVDIKGIDSIKFGTLHSIVTGRAFEELLPEYDPVVTVSEDGPWVFRIPQELVNRLAGLDDTRKEAVAKQWANTEEFKLDGWPEAAVLQTFSSIAQLAERAAASRQALFLWMCL